MVSIDEHGEGKGSGRSVQGFNLHACIASCEDLLLRFGGHAMAAGLSVREENLPELRRRLNEWAARECPVLVTPPLECDLSIRLDRVTVESVAALEKLAGLDSSFPGIVRGCARDSANVERRLWAEREAQAEEDMRAWGVEVTTISEAEMQKFRAAVRPMYERFAEQAELIRQIQEA